jgi:hypothetical protein
VAEVAAEEALGFVRSQQKRLSQRALWFAAVAEVFLGCEIAAGLRLIAISRSPGKFRHSSWIECVSGSFLNFND